MLKTLSTITKPTAACLCVSIQAGKYYNKRTTLIRQSENNSRKFSDTKSQIDKQFYKLNRHRQTGPTTPNTNTQRQTQSNPLKIKVWLAFIPSDRQTDRNQIRWSRQIYLLIFLFTLFIEINKSKAEKKFTPTCCVEHHSHKLTLHFRKSKCLRVQMIIDIHS